MRINYPRADREGWTRFIPSWKLVLGGLASLFAVGVLVFAALFAWAWTTIDIPEENEVAAAQTSIIYWNDGERELARLGDTNRISVPIEDIPEDMQNAVVAAEDRRFFEHSGFDIRGFTRAMWSNLTTGSSQGGSTITQQYAKNAYLTQDKTYIRKFKELVLSFKIEATLSKDEILERYLNTIYFGRGAYGVETAAEAYFGVSASELTLEQSAVLAAIINSPGNFNPETNMDNLEQRYAYVLNGMYDEGLITEQERDDALDSFPEIEDRKTAERYRGTNGFLIRSVEVELLELGFTEAEIAGGGLRIVSTFERKSQRAAVAAVKEQAPTTGMEGVRIGLAAVQPVTGEIVAMYGGANYLEDSLNNATQARYQAGSTFKPFGLAAATEDGIGLDSLWPGDSPTEVAGYEVNNYGDNDYGELVTLLRGTEQSINTVYVSVEDETGVPAVQEAALRAGIPNDTQGLNLEEPNLTFVLGTASPHTLDIAGSYATFAARGERADTTTIRRVQTTDGSTLYERQKSAQRTFDENTADVVNLALQSVVTNGTGGPARALGRPVAGKTGSTDDYKSAWFAGYVPQLAAAVSFGKSGPDGTEGSLSGTGGMTQFYGSGYPARVWTAFMQGALEGTEVIDFVEPTDMPTGGGVATPTPTPSAEASTATPTTEAPSPTPTPEPPSPTPTPEPPTPEPPAPEPPAPEPPAPEPPTPEPTVAQGGGVGQAQGPRTSPLPTPVR
ncbi:MAG TPA: transglycosylase domain-containing protein [Motilibacterales bacterium]|nr:transglycosylase domain-containing protein [Motilibacterales bacterium]